MKNLRFITIAIIVGVSSCKKEQIRKSYLPAEPQLSVNYDVITEENFNDYIEVVASNLEDNSEFVDDFIAKSFNSSLTPTDFDQMIQLFNISASTDVSQLDLANASNGTYGALDQITIDPQLEPSYCDKLVQIRNALVEECEKYPSGVEDYCKTAVAVAYWWKSRNC